VFLLLAIRRDFRTPDFAVARERLAVVQSTFHYAEAGEKCGPNISVVGTIRNNGDIPVKPTESPSSPQETPVRSSEVLSTTRTRAPLVKREPEAFRSFDRLG
jgi:hypothetical protein